MSEEDSIFIPQSYYNKIMVFYEHHNGNLGIIKRTCEGADDVDQIYFPIDDIPEFIKIVSDIYEAHKDD